MSGEVSQPQTAKTESYFQDTWELVAEGDWLVGQRFAISRYTVLGRDSACDITIPGTHLSRRHAELAIKGDALLIRDLNSSNGTFVNNQRVTETSLRPGDSVRFDVLRFKVYGPSNSKPDSQATLIRHPAAPQPTTPRTPPAEKRWKTKPTSVGNRDQTMHFSAIQKAGNNAWTILAVVLGLAAVGGIAYLLTYL